MFVLLNPQPTLYLFFSCNGIIYIFVIFIKNQIKTVVFTCKMIFINSVKIMLYNPFLQAICHTGVDYRFVHVGENVNRKDFLLVRIVHHYGNEVSRHLKVFAKAHAALS